MEWQWWCRLLDSAQRSQGGGVGGTPTPTPTPTTRTTTTTGGDAVGVGHCSPSSGMHGLPGSVAGEGSQVEGEVIEGLGAGQEEGARRGVA